jgi:hypothetical protein
LNDLLVEHLSAAPGSDLCKGLGAVLRGSGGLRVDFLRSRYALLGDGLDVLWATDMLGAAGADKELVA